MDDFGHIGYLGTGVFFVLFLVIQIFYLLSLYTAMEAVPESKRVFPSWFVWLILIPVVGFVFAWIMEPFGLPNSFEAIAGDNQKMKDDSKTLFGFGLAHMILLSVSIIPVIGWITVLVSIVVWIMYWVKVVNFKNTYLSNPLVVGKGTKS